jgi:hypothetical protein
VLQEEAGVLEGQISHPPQLGGGGLFGLPG